MAIDFRPHSKIDFRPRSERAQKATREFEVASAEAKRIASPFGQLKEFGKEIGEITGFLPTGRRIAAGIAPAIIPKEELPEVVEELVGGVSKPRRVGGIGQLLQKTGVSEDISEGIDIAFDLPLISLGLSKTIAKPLAKKAPSVLAKPITDFGPEGLQRIFGKEISLPTERIKTVLNKIRPSNLIGKTQNYLSRANTADNVETSIERLAKTTELKNKTGTRILIKDETPEPVKIEIRKAGFTEEGRYSPLKAYDEFYDQELKFKKDIKEDTAIGKVGERIGDSYERVIKQRTETGARMRKEIEKIGATKVDVSDSFVKLEEELKANGLTYDAKKGIVDRTKISKVTDEDRDLIQEYVANLNDLGANPQAAELDAFLSRMPKELDVAKRKRNIVQVTNGERIIKNNLRALREAFNPKNNKKFAAYFGLRQDYASLSNFLDEGSGFLGGKSQAGDFVKDASVAKSAVQSILNQGKKDWLLKLEDLTGYQALDESVLALQAMKDAGNFRGESLLKLLTEQQGLPTSPRKITERVTKAGLEFLGQQFIGTPRDQTRRTIIEIMQKGQRIPSVF